MIEFIRLVSELFKLFRDYQDKQEKKERRRALREALYEARTKKDTKMLERFFNPDSAIDFSKRLWTEDEKEKVLEEMQSNNKHKAVGGRSEES